MTGLTEEPRAGATAGADRPAEERERVRHRLALEFGSRQQQDDRSWNGGGLFSELLDSRRLPLRPARAGWQPDREGSGLRRAVAGDRQARPAEK